MLSRKLVGGLRELASEESLMYCIQISADSIRVVVVVYEAASAA